MPRIVSKETWTQKEIAAAISNAVVQAKHPNSLKVIPEARMRRLREYALAACEVMLENSDEGLLHPEELVLILLSGALYVQATRVMKSVNVTHLDLGKLLFDKE